MAGICKYGNEPSGSIKCGDFLHYMITGLLLKRTLLYEVIKCPRIQEYKPVFSLKKWKCFVEHLFARLHGVISLKTEK